MKLLKISVVACAILLVAATTSMAHMSKVGFVNPQRIINESRIGQVAQADLAELGQVKDMRVREALDEVEVLKQKLESKTLSDTEEQSIEKMLRLSVREYEQVVKESNLDIQGEERRLIQFVMRRADSILRRIAQEMGFSMILTDPEIIGYVDDSMDITDRVIRELNAMM